MPNKIRNTKKTTPATPKHDIQGLKDRLWNMVLLIDWKYNSLEDVENLDGYTDWDRAMAEAQEAKALPKPPGYVVPGFCIPRADIDKIQEEVDDSCLSDAAKKAILDAVKAAKPE